MSALGKMRDPGSRLGDSEPTAAQSTSLSSDWYFVEQWIFERCREHVSRGPSPDTTTYVMTTCSSGLTRTFTDCHQPAALGAWGCVVCHPLPHCDRSGSEGNPENLSVSLTRSANLANANMCSAAFITVTFQPVHQPPGSVQSATAKGLKPRPSGCPETAKTYLAYGLAHRPALVSTSSETATILALQAACAACWARWMRTSRTMACCSHHFESA